jgi:hypothetical protein
MQLQEVLLDNVEDNVAILNIVDFSEAADGTVEGFLGEAVGVVVVVV